MIDKILELAKKKTNSEEVRAFEEELMSLDNPRYYFLASYYVKGLDIKKLSEKMLATNDKRYIQFYFRQVDNIDLEKFFIKILSFKDAKIIFYSLYDRKKLDDIFFIRGIESLRALDNNHYLGLTFYYYFNVLKRFNSIIFSYLKEVIPQVTEENYVEILERYRNQTKEKIGVHDEECPNKYIGHNGTIPDMIVCHISFDYGRIISLFYDEKTEVSSHFAVSRDGKYQQFVSLDNSSWANGTSFKDTSDVYNAFARSSIVKSRNMNANYYTFTIEHESMDGSLTKVQYQTSLKLMCQIIDYVKETYGVDFPIDKDHIVGHMDINPVVRVSCPGEKFPLEEFILDLRRIYKR